MIAEVGKQGQFEDKTCTLLLSFIANFYNKSIIYPASSEGKLDPYFITSLEVIHFINTVLGIHSSLAD